MLVVGYIIQVNLRVFHSILRTFYRQNCNKSITFFVLVSRFVLCNSRLCVVCVVSRLYVVCVVHSVVGADVVSNDGYSNHPIVSGHTHTETIRCSLSRNC